MARETLVKTDFQMSSECTLTQLQGEISKLYPDIILPPGFLSQCLLVKKGRLEASLDLARKFIEFRRKWNWPFRLKSFGLRDALLSKVHTVSPVRDKLGRTVVYFEPGRIPGTIPLLELHKMACFLLERLTSDKEVQRDGIVLVVDLSDSSVLSVLMSVSPLEYRRGVEMWYCFPCKLKRVFIVNAGPMLRGIAKGVVTWLPGKLRERVSFQSGGSEEMLDELGEHVLPEHLGGTLEFDWTRYIVQQEWVDLD